MMNEKCRVTVFEAVVSSPCAELCLAPNPHREFQTPYLLCDCNLRWLLRWLKDRGVAFLDTRCAYPRSLQGQALDSLKPDLLTCGMSAVSREMSRVGHSDPLGPVLCSRSSSLCSDWSWHARGSVQSVSCRPQSRHTLIDHQIQSFTYCTHRWSVKLANSFFLFLQIVLGGTDLPLGLFTHVHQTVYPMSAFLTLIYVYICLSILFIVFCIFLLMVCFKLHTHATTCTNLLILFVPNKKQKDSDSETFSLLPSTVAVKISCLPALFFFFLHFIVNCTILEFIRMSVSSANYFNRWKTNFLN